MGINFKNIKDQYISLAYRNYLLNDNSSLFYEIFTRYKNLDTESYFVKTANISETNMISFTHMDLGLSLGYRWIIADTFPITIKLGYGYPILGEINYYTTPSVEAKNIIDTVLKITEGISTELSIGIIF
jgi:hypothetical protein